MNINDLKRKHNALLSKGQDEYAKMLETYNALMELQKRIAEIEGDEYDPIPLIFGGCLHIHADDETIEVPE